MLPLSFALLERCCELLPSDLQLLVILLLAGLLEGDSVVDVPVEVLGTGEDVVGGRVPRLE